MWFDKIKWVDSRDAREATERITSSERYFPTPAQFLKYVDDARASRSARENRVEIEQAKHAFETKRYQGMAKDCALLIDLACKKKRSGLQVASYLHDMEKIYPGIGFEQEAGNLDRQLEQKETAGRKHEEIEIVVTHLKRMEQLGGGKTI